MSQFLQGTMVSMYRTSMVEKSGPFVKWSGGKTGKGAAEIAGNRVAGSKTGWWNGADGERPDRATRDPDQRTVSSRMGGMSNLGFCPRNRAGLL